MRKPHVHRLTQTWLRVMRSSCSCPPPSLLLLPLLCPRETLAAVTSVASTSETLKSRSEARLPTWIGLGLETVCKLRRKVWLGRDPGRKMSLVPLLKSRKLIELYYQTMCLLEYELRAHLDYVNQSCDIRQKIIWSFKTMGYDLSRQKSQTNTSPQTTSSLEPHPDFVFGGPKF